jgi:RNA-directed DNA polymerase
MNFRRLRVESEFTREPLALKGLNSFDHRKIFSPSLPTMGKPLSLDEIVVYKTQTLTKRDGTKRYISVPSQQLHQVQKMLLSEFFSKPDLVHPAAFAYIPGRSAIDCARVHENAHWLIKIDLQDFFHSIDDRQLSWEFRRRSVEKPTAEVLSFLLTRSAEDLENHLPKKYSSKVLGGRARFLPQGSPTSGFLSNLVFYDLDSIFLALADEFNLAYSRYSDDLIFSSPTKFDRPRAEFVMRELVRVAKKRGFRVNGGKSRIIPPGARKQILGVLVGSPGIRLRKAARKHIDAHLWAIRKYGFDSHYKRAGARSEYSLLNSLYGYLVWSLSVDPEWTRPRLNELLELAETQLGKIEPI